jgi:hypothetical protein
MKKICAILFVFYCFLFFGGSVLAEINVPPATTPPPAQATVVSFDENLKEELAKIKGGIRKANFAIKSADKKAEKARDQIEKTIGRETNLLNEQILSLAKTGGILLLVIAAIILTAGLYQAKGSEQQKCCSKKDSGEISSKIDEINKNVKILPDIALKLEKFEKSAMSILKAKPEELEYQINGTKYKRHVQVVEDGRGGKYLSLRVVKLEGDNIPSDFNQIDRNAYCGLDDLKKVDISVLRKYHAIVAKHGDVKTFLKTITDIMEELNYRMQFHLLETLLQEKKEIEKI